MTDAQQDPSTPPGTPSRRMIWLCLAAAAVPYLVMLGTPALWDHNEPLYAEPPREVLAGGSFLAPTCNDVVYYPHPPLATWITVPFFALLGPSELGHRLPMAIASLITILCVFHIGRRQGGARTGLMAALMLAATPRFWLFARQLSGDVYMVTLLTAGLMLALPRLDGDRRALRYHAGHALAGIGCLAKGPVIAGLYGGALGIAWLLTPGRVSMRHLQPLRSLGVLVLFGGPWFVWMGLTDPDFAGAFFGRYTFDRFAGELGARGVAFYLVALAGDAQPWLVLIPFAVVMARRSGSVQGTAARVPWVLMAWTLFVFTLSAGKRNVYLLPVYPMLTLVTAPVVLAVWDGAGRRGVRIGGAALAFGALATAACLWMVKVHEPRVAPDIYAPIVVLAAFALVTAFGTARASGRIVAGCAIAGGLALQAATALSFPALDRFRPVPALADEIRAAESRLGSEQPVITFAAPVHSMRFYLARPTRVAAGREDLRDHLGPVSRAFILVYAHRDGRLREAAPELTLTELARGPELRFNFKASVLGRRKTTRDLVLYLAEGRMAGAPAKAIPAGGCE